MEEVDRIAHGQPDYADIKRLKAVDTMSDIGELAARLGSIVTHDRRGDVVWFDDFEAATLHWADDKQGTGAAVALSALKAYRGQQSVKLTTGDTKYDYGGIKRYHQPPIIGNFGIEVAFTLTANTEYFNLYFYHYDGSLEWWGFMSFDRVNSRLRCYQKGATYADIATGLTSSADTDLFYVLKFVVDLNTHKYIRAIFMGVEYDLSAYTMYSTTEVGPKMIIVAFNHSTAAASNESIYADNFIMTQNEP